MATPPKSTVPSKAAAPAPVQASSLTPKATTSDSALANLLELRPGLFLNPDQIVSLRVLPPGSEAFAVLQLSNGDKLNLVVEEFEFVTGERRQNREITPGKPSRS